MFIKRIIAMFKPGSAETFESRYDRFIEGAEKLHGEYKRGVGLMMFR